MPSTDPKHPSSSRPVNLRTTARSRPKAQTFNPVVQERLAAKWAKSKLGVPLAEQLQPATLAGLRPHMSAWFIAGVMVCAASAIVLFLAWIQQSLRLALAAVAPLTISLGLMAWFFRKAHQVDTKLTPMLFDQASICAFDQALEALSPDITDATAAQLTSIKQQLASLARLSANVSVDENFTLEDRMYLTELVRRYLPDSLQSYLRVPKEQRTAQIFEQGATAESLLTDQLTLLGNELNKRALKLTKSSASKLFDQQRFLASKSTP